MKYLQYRLLVERLALFMRVGSRDRQTRLNCYQHTGTIHLLCDGDSRVRPIVESVESRGLRA